ncbi:MAG TPA: carbohydrate ABC transporter permease [Paenibacillus sp.]|uniref:carbohydrate ABC transporter permease n=1 Tax=Paenibacillus sp. TaxID=58172 RepID=UPI002BCA3A53|nr:carbohydrate ABC transporter permease [Paenibacillus sp.]HUC91914.1 carbohydrate ABC transporter permease [Paenibacillus sp.]
MLIEKKYRIWIKVLTYSVLVVFGLYTLFPFLWMVSTSFKPTDEVRSASPSFFTSNPTAEHYYNILALSKFSLYFLNSLKVASITTMLAILLSVFSAYALSRLNRVRGVRYVSTGMMLTQLIPSVLLVLPLYVFMMKTQLLDTFYSLIIAYTTFMLPMCVMMLKGFFDSIPYEMEESAMIDGCSRLGIVVRMIIPLSLPSIIATSLFAFVGAWNEFLFAFTFINKDEFRTLTPGLSLLRGLFTTDWGSLMAASVLSVVPIALAFAYLQRFLVAGLTAGSVKG